MDYKNSISTPLIYILAHLEKGCDVTTDIKGRSLTSYTAPYNGVVSHGAQIGDLWAFADHICKYKRKTNASTTFVRRANDLRVCLFTLRLQ